MCGAKVNDAQSNTFRSLSLRCWRRRFPAVTLVLMKLIRPDSRPVGDKLKPYECGVPAESDARGRYSVRFYIIAMLFVIFDVETIFLFPWAVLFLDARRGFSPLAAVWFGEHVRVPWNLDRGLRVVVPKGRAGVGVSRGRRAVGRFPGGSSSRDFFCPEDFGESVDGVFRRVLETTVRILTCSRASCARDVFPTHDQRLRRQNSRLSRPRPRSLRCQRLRQ